jgi:hypothetical protein
VDKNEIKECEYIFKSLHSTKPITLKHTFSFSAEQWVEVQKKRLTQRAGSKRHWLFTHTHTHTQRKRERERHTVHV